MPEAQDEKQTEMLFMQLIMMFHGMAMQQMGKVANPVTNQVERDLGQSKNFIDLLQMIHAKTEGNLTDNEKRMIDHVLYELRMNYVDEVKKGNAPAKPDEEAADSDGEGESESAKDEASS